MSSSAVSRISTPSRGRAAAWLHRAIPLWTILVFGGAIAVAYSPNLLQVYSINDDYDVLVFTKWSFLVLPRIFASYHLSIHPETLHLFAIARPVAALFTNLPLWPVQSWADFRWVRLFAVLTVCFLGTQMLANCIVRLHIRPLDAVAVALATFFGLAFIYATMDATAWAPHLLTTLIAFGAYTILGRSNLQSIPFLILAKQGDWLGLGRQIFVYSFSRPVWTACLVYQLALYDYPPYALMLTLFPVITVLFSQAPRAYRTLIASRDVLFIAANVLLYAASTALVYLPFVRLFTREGTDAAGAYGSDTLDAFYAAYRFQYNTNLVEILGRLAHLTSFAGDLWFLAQSHMHIVTAATLLFALLVANSTALLARVGAPFCLVHERASIARLRFDSWSSGGAITIAVLTICLAMSSSPVWGSFRGFIVYRTNAVPTALAAIVFIFAVRGIAEALWQAVGNPRFAAPKVADAAMALTVCAALAASFYANYTTMRLGRNEFAYFTGIVREAIDTKSKTIMIIDPRAPVEDMSVVYDEQGRAIPGYEIGCFASYCEQRGMIIRVAAAELGHSYDAFSTPSATLVDPLPGLTCEMLTESTPSFPSLATVRSVTIINNLASDNWVVRHYPDMRAPVTCVTYSEAWHDVGLELSR
jgi:hypothetical protein